MKKILILAIALLIGLTSCQKAMDEIFDLDFDRIFIPTGLEVVMSQVPDGPENQTTMSIITTFRWNQSSNPYVTTYRFQFGTDSTFQPGTYQEWFLDTTAFQLEPNQYFNAPRVARVMAVAPAGADESDSKWHEISFNTPHEDLFKAPEARAIRSRMANLKWYIGEVTRFTIATAGQPTNSFNLSSEEIATGTLSISDLNPSTVYTITLFRGATQRRGQIQFTTLPGFNCDANNVVCLLDGSVTLRAAMENPENVGRVILLPPGFTETITGAVAIAGTMHLFGDADADAHEVPRITFAGTGAGNHLFTLPTTADSIVFQNIEVVGQGGPPFFYIINQAPATSTDIGTVRFENTSFTNFGEGGIRLQGNPAGQHIENLIINNSVFRGFGHEREGGRFAFISVTAATAGIENIRVSNSTFSEMQHSFMNLQGAPPTQVVNTIVVESSTFDRIISPDRTDRYFIDGHTHSEIRIEIRNTIFGSTHENSGTPTPGNGPRGIRISAAAPTTIVENSFRTDDWRTYNPAPPSEDNFDIPNLTSTGGTRNALFANPDAGDFSLIPTTGAVTTAGDPRWR